MPTMLMDGSSTIKAYNSNYSSEDVTTAALTMYQKIPTIEDATRQLILKDISVLDKYRSEFSYMVTSRALTEKEYNKYKFNPKLLSYDLYGTTELWQIILDLNQIKSILDFDLRSVKLYPSSFFNKLTRIIALEKANINYNRANL